ncbi:hypothetical protein DL98DRAFT_45197 [Cadophora sp. DSE1049]|nr:hypothetical protein DL98DRAFT_45197 [Cadophora sp. DSE1049]
MHIITRVQIFGTASFCWCFLTSQLIRPCWSSAMASLPPVPHVFSVPVDLPLARSLTQHPGRQSQPPCRSPGSTLDAHSNNQIQGFLRLAWICGERNIPCLPLFFWEWIMDESGLRCTLTCSCRLFLNIAHPLDLDSLLRSLGIQRSCPWMSTD